MSEPINDGGPAFPQPLSFSPNGEAVTAGMYFPEGPGMTLRDYFASKAPPPPKSFERASWSEMKIVPAPEMGPGYVKEAWVTSHETDADYIARWNFTYADAMLRAREKKGA